MFSRWLGKWSATRRRFSLKTFVISLAAVYFLVMYVFHSDLDGSNVQSRNEKLIADVGGDSFTRKHGGSGANIRQRVNLEKVFDLIQNQNKHQQVIIGPAGVEQTANISEKEKLEPYFLPNLELDWAYWNISDINKFKDKPNKIPLEDSNIPSGCVKDRPLEDGKFHQVTPGIYLYSAYWDTRTNDFDNKNSGKYIRIMAVIHRKIKPSLYCNFPSAIPSGGWQRVSDMVQTSISYYEMCENHNRPHGGFILSCLVPDFIYAPPCAINISSQDSIVSIGIRTIKPIPDRRKFTICVPPLFGKISRSHLVEFIEMSSILGANHIMFYNYNVSSDIKSLLDSYRSRTDRISIVPWNLDNKIDTTIWYHGQLIAIQDCLYRNMAISEFIAFGDIDEYITPRITSYWSEMIETIDKPIRCAFQFQSAFFEPVDSAVVKEIGLTLQTQSTMVRTENFSKIRAKCVVKPYSIFEKGIHHVSKPILAKLEVHQVDPVVAFLNHYRPCARNMAMDCLHKITDKKMLKYSQELIKRLLVVRKDVLLL